MDNRRVNILIVDDDEQILSVLQDYLQEHNHVVHTSLSAEEALDLTSLDSVEVALIDIHLKGKLTGHDLVDRFNESLPGAQMILMSGRGEIDDLVAAFERHVFTFLNKPFKSLAEIDLIIRRAAEARENAIAARRYTEQLEHSKQDLEQKVSERTTQLARMRNIVSHLFSVSSKLGLIEPLDSLLNYVCRSIVDAGAFRRAVLLLADEKFMVRHIGYADIQDNTELFRQRVLERRDAPLRPYDFLRDEDRIGTGYYTRAAETPTGETAQSNGWQFGDQLTVPLRKQDGTIFGYLSVDEPYDGSRPTEEIIQYLDVLLNHSSLHVEAQQYRDALRRRADELEEIVQSRTTELRQSQEKFSRLVNLTTDIVYVTDADGKINYLNDAFMNSLGYVRENYIGQCLSDVLEELVTDDPANRHEIQQLSSEDAGVNIHHIELLTRQGDKRIFEINRAVIRQGGEFIGTQGIARDVTEHRALLKRVMTSERLAATGRLAAGIAHEINNPLQAIFSHINAVKKHSSEKEAVKHADLIAEGVDRIRTIVRGMLDLHRTQSAATVDINLNTLVEKVLALTGKQLRNADVESDLQLSQKLPTIKGAPSDLQQVLLNLVLNSIDAMPDGGKLTIETTADETHAEIVVRDTGVGIQEDLQAKIFEPFFTSRQGGGGVGLGLYLTRNIIEIHQGTIQVESQPGKGTLFRIRLPRPAQ